MNDSEKKIAAGCIVAPLLMVASVLLNGWALQIVWSWFIVPLGVPGVGLVQAIGIACVARMLTHQDVGDPNAGKTTSELLWKGAAYAVISPLVVVAFCWFVRWCGS